MFKRNERYSFKSSLPKGIYSTHSFVVRYQQNPLNMFHCAVVVSRKVSKSAVDRNRIKRVFVQALQDIRKENEINYDLVFYLKKDILQRETEVSNLVKNALFTIKAIQQ